MSSRIIMIKDSYLDPRNGGSIDVSKHLANGYGFACVHKYTQQVWYDASKLRLFKPTRYINKWDQMPSHLQNRSISFNTNITFGDWIQSMKLPQHIQARRYWPICYRGAFITSRADINRIPLSVWERIERSMRRGNNIVEGHYMERTWAALLTQPLDKNEERAMLCAIQSSKFNPDKFGSVYGCRTQCSNLTYCRNSFLTT